MAPKTGIYKNQWQENRIKFIYVLLLFVIKSNIYDYNP